MDHKGSELEINPWSVGGDLKKHLNTFTRKLNRYIRSIGRTIHLSGERSEQLTNDSKQCEL